MFFFLFFVGFQRHLRSFTLNLLYHFNYVNVNPFWFLYFLINSFSWLIYIMAEHSFFDINLDSVKINRLQKKLTRRSLFIWNERKICFFIVEVIIPWFTHNDWNLHSSRCHTHFCCFFLISLLSATATV